jgi:purine-nucleoside phosphorylase
MIQYNDTMITPDDGLQETIRHVRNLFSVPFDAAVVLGSGLGGFSDGLTIHHSVPTSDIPGYPASTVAGHSGLIVDASLGDRRTLIFHGRIHGYEGYSPGTTALPALIAAALGVPAFIVTNAAGGLNPLYEAGDLMLVTDYFVLPLAHRMGLTLSDLDAPTTGRSRSERGLRPGNFLPAIARNLAHAAAAETGVVLREGTYGFCSGPSYETRAEIHFLRMAGVDAVGMSTVPELIVARRHGLQTIAISCITNKARTVATAVSHEEVTRVAIQASDRLSRLLHALILSLGRHAV